MTNNQFIKYKWALFFLLLRKNFHVKNKTTKKSWSTILKYEKLEIQYEILLLFTTIKWEKIICHTTTRNADR